MIDNDYKNMLLDVLLHGEETNPRGMKTKEMLAYRTQPIDSKYCIISNEQRKLNYAFMVAEWLWIMFGRDDTDFIGTFNKKILN